MSYTIITFMEQGEHIRFAIKDELSDIMLPPIYNDEDLANSARSKLLGDRLALSFECD